MLQTLVVFFVVLVCAVYAAWTLMPQSLRRWLATVLLALPMPVWAKAKLQRASAGAAGCHCDGCDAAVATAAKAVKPMVFHPPKRR